MNIPDLPDTVQDARAWRADTRRNPAIYAVNPDGPDQRIGTALDPGIAAQIIAEHALCTLPYADDEHLGGSWVQMLSHFMGRVSAMQREIDDLRAGKERYEAEQEETA